MGRLAGAVGRAIVALVVVGLLIAAVLAWRAHVPVGSVPLATSEPSARATPATPAVKPAPKESVTTAPGSNPRRLDALLFFLAVLSGHRAVGR